MFGYHFLLQEKIQQMRDEYRREVCSIAKKQDIEKSGLLRKIRDMRDEVKSQKVSPHIRII